MKCDILKESFMKNLDVAFGLRTGTFPEDNDVKCYVNCVFEMMNMMKKGKFNLEQTRKQVELMLPEVPEDYKTPMLASMEICKDSTKGIKDNCEASYTLMKCIQKNNPKFVFA